MAWRMEQCGRCWVALTVAASAVALGCSSESRLQRTVAEYGERLEQIREASDQHEVEVSAAENEQEVADTEQRHADQMMRTFSEMDQLISAMGTCRHHAEHQHNTAALRGDIETMSAMFDQHHEAMTSAGDMNAAHAEESAYQRDLHTALDGWFGHHHEMTAHAGDCPCGNMGGTMMGR